MKKRRAPFPLHLLHFTCPPWLYHQGREQGQLGLCTAGGWGQHSRAEHGAVTSRPTFGVIRPLLIQLQKFGKHFVNNPRPGRAMFSRADHPSGGDFCSPDAALFNAGISGCFAAEANPPRFAAEGEEGEAEGPGGF